VAEGAPAIQVQGEREKSVRSIKHPARDPPRDVVSVRPGPGKRHQQRAAALS